MYVIFPLAQFFNESIILRETGIVLLKSFFNSRTNDSNKSEIIKLVSHWNRN